MYGYLFLDVDNNNRKTKTYDKNQNSKDIGATWIKWKPNVVASLEAWQTQWNTRNSEAIKTRHAEDGRIETRSQLDFEDQDYLLVYVRVKILLMLSK